MPITITNISPERNPADLSDYSLTINGKEIVRFQHYRDLGLADCLRLAASAVDRRAHPSPQEGSE